jgi:hypothetical protein
MGERLLRKHGLSDWTFRTRTPWQKLQYGDKVGSCRHDRKEIVVGVEQVVSRYELRQSILHEIAHALSGSKAGHGPRWQKKARELGISQRNISVNLGFACAKWWDVGCWPWPSSAGYDEVAQKITWGANAPERRCSPRSH